MSLCRGIYESGKAGNEVLGEVMSDRRSPFGNLPPNATSNPKPLDIYESLPVAEPRRRNRDWERRHQNQKVIYRGVDPRLTLRVKIIAKEINVREGEVARFFLEYGLRAYGTGEMDLTPYPNPERLRMTLFPSTNQYSHQERRSSSTHKAHRKKTNTPFWKVITTWRNFSLEVKSEISDLASEAGLGVPVGELVTALLHFSLNAYDRGLLKLEPVAEMNNHKLLERGEF
jgi:hypothetical protein